MKRRVWNVTMASVVAVAMLTSILVAQPAAWAGEGVPPVPPAIAPVNGVPDTAYEPPAQPAEPPEVPVRVEPPAGSPMAQELAQVRKQESAELAEIDDSLRNDVVAAGPAANSLGVASPQVRADLQSKIQADRGAQPAPSGASKTEALDSGVATPGSSPATALATAATSGAKPDVAVQAVAPQAAPAASGSR